MLVLVYTFNLYFEIWKTCRPILRPELEMLVSEIWLHSGLEWPPHVDEEKQLLYGLDFQSNRDQIRCLFILYTLY